MIATVLRREPPGAPTGASARTLSERVFRIRETGIIVVLALFVAVTAGLQHRFLSASNIQFVLVNTTIYALLALGETMVVVSRNLVHHPRRRHPHRGRWHGDRQHVARVVHRDT
jgi:hypothetical protein